jgi:hypothetical protein
MAEEVAPATIDEESWESAADVADVRGALVYSELGVIERSIDTIDF